MLSAVSQAAVLSQVSPPSLPHAPQCPRERHLVAKSGSNVGPVDLSSDVP